MNKNFTNQSDLLNFILIGRVMCGFLYQFERPLRQRLFYWYRWNDWRKLRTIIYSHAAFIYRSRTVQTLLVLKQCMITKWWKWHNYFNYTTLCDILAWCTHLWKVAQLKSVNFTVFKKEKKNNVIWKGIKSLVKSQFHSIF